MAYQPFTGQVIVGKQLGKKLGFPTANVSCFSSELSTGTYKINTVYDEKIYHGVGTYFSDQQLFEAHLFGFNKDIYGEKITVYPLFKIRENQSFSSIEELVAQIEKDVLRAYQHTWTVLTFGTFDHFHPGHTYYLYEAKKYGDRLVTVIARDATVEKIKGNPPDTPETTRKQIVAESGIPDLVVLGDKESYYTCLRDFTPNIICLGYDQYSFDTGIIDFCDSHNIATSIVRLAPFQPDRRKSSLIKRNS